MNEDMKAAWLEISQMLGEPTKEELDVFLRTWQRAIQAEQSIAGKKIQDFKERLARSIELMPFGDTAASFAVYIREFE